jgi:hypothetical protein
MPFAEGRRAFGSDDMTGRWITVSLVALALAGCHKKEAAKPPPPKTETPAPPETTVTPPATTAPAVTEPTASEPVAGAPPPPAPGVTPTTTPDAPPAFVPVKPLRPVIRPPIKVVPLRPGLKVVKSKAQLKAEHDVLGLWIEQKRRNSVLNFTVDGKVTQVEKITDKPLWKGEWKADQDGAVQFGLAMDGATSSLRYTAYPTSANIMAVAPHWTKEWGGSGQYAFERMR